MDTIWFLGVLLTIPILVHLFSFRKAKKHYFSNLRFITKISTQSKSKSRLKHYLILVTRIFSFLLLLILLFNFYFELQGNTQIDKDNVFVDRTPSMSIEYKTTRSIDQAEDFLLKFNQTSNKEDFQSSPLQDYYTTVISDFQGVEIEDLNKSVSDTSVSKAFIVTGELTEYKNAFIDSMSIDFNPDDLSQVRILLFPRVSNSLKKGNLVFRLLHQRRQLSSVVKDIQDLNSIVFDVPVDSYGDYTVEIDGDQVYYDNEFRFTISERRKPVISIIDLEANIFIKEVFANKDLFDTHELDPSSLDFELLKRSDAIILNGLMELPSGLSSQLSNKTVVSFPPTRSREKVESVWMNFKVSIQNDSSKYDFDLNFDHPLLSGIFSKISKMNSFPSAATCFEIAGEYEKIISLRNGEPLLIKEIQKEQYVFNVPLDLDYTNLPTHSMFLPLLYKIVLSAVDYDYAPYYYPGELGFLAVENREAPPKIVSEKLEVIPQFNPSEGGITFSIPDLPPGFYQLFHERDTFRIAINTKKEESIMEGITLNELEKNFGDLNHISIQSANSPNFLAVDVKDVLWKYALILVFFILMTETLFHKYLK